MKDLSKLSVEELEHRDRQLTRSLYRSDFNSTAYRELLQLLGENHRALKRAKRLLRTGHAGYCHVHGPKKGQPISTKQFPAS